jgi:hypothetical protein
MKIIIGIGKVTTQQYPPGSFFSGFACETVELYLT